MSVNITLPASLVDDLPEWAIREGVSVQDHARLVLELTSALLDPSRDSPLHLALAAYFADRSLDAEPVAEALREILLTAARRHDTGKESEPFQAMSPQEPQESLQGLASVIRQRCDISSRPSKKVAGSSALGKFAFVPGGSDEFAREKQFEIEKEDRPRS